MKICPSCGIGNQDTAAFCSQCGTDIRTVMKKTSAPRQRAFCTSCGARIANGGKFCPSCGARQNTETPPRGAQTVPPPAGQAAPNRQASAAPAAQGQQQAPAARKAVHVLKRAVFGIVSIVLLCLTAYILVNALPSLPGGRDLLYSAKTRQPTIELFMSRLGPDLRLIGISALAAVILASLLSMIPGHGARKLLAFVSVLLISVSFPAAFFLIAFRMIGRSVTLCGIFSLTLFLTGFLLRAAIMPRKKDGFAGALGAVCAALGTGNGIGLAAGFAVALEMIYSLPGSGYAMLSGYINRDSSVMFVGLVYAFVLFGILRIVFDCIAAILGFDFEGECLASDAMQQPEGRRWDARIIAFAVIAGCFLIIAFIMPVLGKYGSFQVDPMSRLVGPGENGHFLGTDTLGRDLFARIAAGVRNSLGLAVMSLLIASVIGGLIGMAAGNLKGAGRAVLEGIIYIFGFLPILVVPMLCMKGEGNIAACVFCCALFWGGIAEKLALYISDLRENKDRRLSRSFAPVLEELVFSFILLLFIGTIWSFAGVLIAPPTASIGNVLSNSLAGLFMHPWLSIPAAVFFFCMLVFGLLQASLFSPGDQTSDRE